VLEKVVGLCHLMGEHAGGVDQEATKRRFDRGIKGASHR